MSKNPMLAYKKNGSKKVVSHLKEDIHESKESIREDKKLMTAMKSAKSARGR